jgi:uncharacterized spore protein YtfJ
MPPFRVLAALVTVVALTGCGSGADDPQAVPAPATPSVSPVTSAPAAASGNSDKATDAKPKAGGAAAGSAVEPEVVVPSTTDARSQAALTGWQGTVIEQLRRIDPRLVTDQATVIRKVRATCDQMSTGLFETKVVPIIVQRFSNAKIRVTEDIAQGIYTVLLQDACYVLNNPT